MTSYYGWVPPTVDEANFTSCEAAAPWLTAYLKTGNADGSIQNYSSLGFAYTYIASLVPSSMTTPTVGQAMQWYTSMNDSDDPDYIIAMLSFPLNNCSSEVCQSLPWDGDSDLAGIGVMIVYYLAAALSTAYFVLLATRGWFTSETRLSKLSQWWNKLLDAFEESVGSFLDAALLFCIAMLVSGTYRHASSRIHPDKTHSLYWLTNATYLAMFTIFPALVLQIAVRDPKVIRRNLLRKKIRAQRCLMIRIPVQEELLEDTKVQKEPMEKIRLLYWFLVIVFTVTNMTLYYTLTYSGSRLTQLLARESANVDVVWSADCEPKALRNAIEDAMIVGEALLGINFFVWVYQMVRKVLKGFDEKQQPQVDICEKMHGQVVRLLSTTKHVQVQQAWERLVRVFGMLNGLLCCAVMWALLGLFTGYRQKVEETMGGSDGDAQWSFGQVLALATWVPVAIALLTELNDH